MPAEASSSVELLSPIALHDAPAEASYGFRGCLPCQLRSLQAPIDWGQSIYHASGGVFQCRAIVPNSSTRRASGGVFRFSAVCLASCGGFRRRSIGDNRSTMPAEATPSVELLSPIALHDAQAEASYGFRGCLPCQLRWLQAPIDWGQSIYHASGGVFQCRAIVPNSSTRRASGGVLRFSRLFALPVAVASGADRLGTIDLPNWLRSIGAIDLRLTPFS
jgi:hypothetical protein